jgi:hypothetical protein
MAVNSAHNHFAFRKLIMPLFNGNCQTCVVILVVVVRVEHYSESKAIKAKKAGSRKPACWTLAIVMVEFLMRRMTEAFQNDDCQGVK